MSRLGLKPIVIPENVKVAINGSEVMVEGPKGSLALSVRPEIGVEVVEGSVKTFIKQETKKTSGYWGLTRSLIANMVTGVIDGYEKRLELVGVGYRAKQDSPDSITITAGFSHPVEFKIPEGVKVTVVDNQHITVSGIDKHLVGLTASRIRKIRKPEPYKGKGIRYEGEVVRRKPGKAGKAVG
ncbi:50S ribosomal protein L6 [Patescibacteria group bacterium]|nr:50S ribosomal protein L6 [Patescibacteria group bacterium]